MARYTGPKARKWRRLGQVPTDGSAKTVSRRLFPPGQHGQRRQGKQSEFSVQLQEKQKARLTYGVLERQFRNYYQAADQAQGMTGIKLMELLERRLDNVVYRLGLAQSRNQARQIVNHGHVLVGGTKVSIPSFQVKVGDEITLHDKYRQGWQERADLEALKKYEAPTWLRLDPKKLTGSVAALPSRDDIDASINEQLIVEFYSR